MGDPQVIIPPYQAPANELGALSTRLGVLTGLKENEGWKIFAGYMQSVAQKSMLACAESKVESEIVKASGGMQMIRMVSFWVDEQIEALRRQIRELEKRKEVERDRLHGR